MIPPDFYGKMYLKSLQGDWRKMSNYYFIGFDGNVYRAEFGKWQPCMWHLGFGNVFKTEKEAIKANKRIFKEIGGNAKKKYKNSERYWFISSWGFLGFAEFCSFQFCKDRHKFGNVFKSKKIVKEAKREIQKILKEYGNSKAKKSD